MPCTVSGELPYGVGIIGLWPYCACACRDVDAGGSAEWCTLHCCCCVCVLAGLIEKFCMVGCTPVPVDQC